MTIKLAILKSGDEVISDIKEGFFDNKMINYVLNYPCKVDINGSYTLYEDDEDGQPKERYNISLTKWPILSSDDVVSVPPDWVAVIAEPNRQLKELYETQVLGLNKDGEKNDQDIVFTEQSDSDQSD